MKILVVEDEERIAHFIQKGLQEEGHAVVLSYDGEDGSLNTAYAAGGVWWTEDSYRIPAQPDRGIWLGLSMDVDRSGGANDGRIYIAVADQAKLRHLAIQP